MSHQTKNIQFYYFSLIMLMMILMQSACSKEDDDRETFINSIQGEWQVSRIERIALPGGYPEFIIQNAVDSLFYIDDNWDTSVVYLNDPNLCMSPEIEKMCHWTITEKKGDLLLETIDLCSVINNYNIEFEIISISRDWDWTGMYLYEDIRATVKLLGANTSISLNNFNMSNGFSMDYTVISSNHKYTYHVVR